VHNLIYQRADASVIRRRAMQLGMRTLREDGFRKAAAGITTIPEVLRITMERT
jgi:general secretion pathway protein E